MPCCRFDRYHHNEWITQTPAMPLQAFYLFGQSPSTAKEIEVDASQTFDSLKFLIAAHFAIVEPNGR